jgi:bifunctional DNA-binding transcriptional regulator/antitoxin component of YhaV-PrlF toxin-antitoxin module
MKPLKREIMQVNGSRYALIPHFIAEPYGIEPGSSVEFDTSDSEVLVLRIRGGGQK